MSRGTAIGERTHPLHVFAARLHGALDTVGSPAPWSLTQAELTETLTELHAGVARLQGHALTLVGHADATNLASETGQVSTAALLRSLTRMTVAEANRAVKTAGLMERMPPTADALLTGAVNVAQAAEILKAVAALPEEVGDADREKAERHLVDLAARHDARELRQLGRYLLDVIDPDGADQRLADQLAKDEAKAARTRFLSLRPTGDGSLDLRGRIPTLHGTMLERALAALLNPHRPDPIDRDGRSKDELNGEAFCQLLERLDPTRLPKLGGMNATVVVTMTLDTLLGGIAPAMLDTGQPISAREARRLACAAGVIPAVLDGDGAVLDLGPHVRFHTEKQRLAMLVQQQGKCAVEGCDRPAWACDAAHLIGHHDGGNTSVEDGCFTCPGHHAMVDSPHYTYQRLGPGRIRLIRRQ